MRSSRPRAPPTGSRPGSPPRRSSRYGAAWPGRTGAGSRRGKRRRPCTRPDQRGRGLGTRLLAWVEARARELGSERLGQNVADADRAAAGLLEAHGYEDRGSSWLLEIALTGEPVVPALPDGITIRPFRPGDEHATYRLTEDAFNEGPDRRPRRDDQRARHHIHRPALAPALPPPALARDPLAR